MRGCREGRWYRRRSRSRCSLSLLRSWAVARLVEQMYDYYHERIVAWLEAQGPEAWSLRTADGWRPGGVVAAQLTLLLAPAGISPKARYSC